MKTFAFLLILSALAMTQGAKWMQRIQTGFRQQQIDVAMQRTNEAKASFSQANADNENAIEEFNQGTAEEREQTLMDLGLMTDKTALCLRDPGALDEQPRVHTPAELDAIAHEARVQSGASMTIAMR